MSSLIFFTNKLFAKDMPYLIANPGYKHSWFSSCTIPSLGYNKMSVQQPHISYFVSSNLKTS